MRISDWSSDVCSSDLGTVPPTEGEVDIYGKIEALLQAGVGFHPDFTGRENIHAFFAYKNISRETLAFCERDIADFSEMGDFLDQPISSYSFGMLRLEERRVGNACVITFRSRWS